MIPLWSQLSLTWSDPAIYLQAHPALPRFPFSQLARDSGSTYLSVVAIPSLPIGFLSGSKQLGKEPCFPRRQNLSASYFPPQLEDFLSLKMPLWTHEDLAFGGSELFANLLWP